MKMKLVIAAAALLVVGLSTTASAPALAQRCPAGQDQFHNCLSMDPGMRTRQEQWANQPAARRIPGAQPYGTAASAPPLVTGTTPTLQGRDYRMNTPSGPVVFRHHFDGKTTSVTTASGERFRLVTVNCGRDFCMYRDGRLVRRIPR
jgi:hypothetical protein